eukprot:jgi/Orpsp1_1/1176311/evm.model.c7180000057141.1
MNGPITINTEKDDGTKRNLFNIVKMEDNSFYYNQEYYNKLNETISMKSEFFCELKNKYRPEGIKGYDISCPLYYKIKIDKAFYGRYAKDKKHCKKINGVILPKIKLKIKDQCGYEPTKYVKELCEEKEYCTIIPTNNFFDNYCGDISKYLHIKYHCVKDSIMKKEKISIVSFYNDIKVNTIQESSISEIYQYANIHGYDFELNSLNYSPGREIFFMKLFTVIEKILEGLKYKKYDWIFWVDSDVIVLNPNIKLETFLPDEKMNKIHLIAAYDYRGNPKYCCGLNAGIFFIRVHEWSLNFLMRVISYPYFNIEKKIFQSDQTSMNNVLIESNEYEHFIIVPPHWFNTKKFKEGIFLYHIMGTLDGGKEKLYRDFLNMNKEILKSNTNEEIRKEVLRYYKLPREKQLKIEIQP